MKTAVVSALLVMTALQDAPSRRTYVFKSVGECHLKADVYRAATPGPRPAILWIHGGALIFGSRADINRRQLAGLP